MLRWNNPRLHTPDRRKEWLACEAHRESLGAFLQDVLFGLPLVMHFLTSSLPNRRYATGLRRLGVEDPRALAFFDEHVEADAVHEQLVRRELGAGLLEREPELAADVVLGIQASTLLAKCPSKFETDATAGA